MTIPSRNPVLAAVGNPTRSTSHSNPAIARTMSPKRHHIGLQGHAMVFTPLSSRFNSSGVPILDPAFAHTVAWVTGRSS
jgi:hypothetical protein